MPLITTHTRSVRKALKASASRGIDILVLCGVAGAIGLVLMFGQQVISPYNERTTIDLSLWSLPQYTIFSLCRGIVAYLISLVFALSYGTIAAHNPRAEKVMMPLLDILQAIPVLGFLPGLVLTLISIFPSRELGLELACIIMIFTGQAWNMVFSFHGSLKSIPLPMREAARVHGLSGWKTFKLLELPAAMIGLVWNSMMSMAGGWFFLTVNEAFTLGNKDYRLPGIGSYMNEAINRGDLKAMTAAVISMIVMIVFVDQFFWRPIVVWSQRYKLEETAEAKEQSSWVLDIIRKSKFYRWYKSSKKRKNRKIKAPIDLSEHHFIPRQVQTACIKLVTWIFLAGIALAALLGLYQLFKLLTSLPLRSSSDSDWVDVLLALLASFARTTSAVLLATLWTLPIGIKIGLSPTWSRRLQPVIQVLASFPAPMLFPVVTIILQRLGIPFNFGCTALMLLGAQWYILFNVIAGASAIPADLKEVGEAYRMNEKRKWLELYLPSVFPYLITGLITAAGGAWNATIVSEYLQIKDHTMVAFGLGSLISQATYSGNFPLLCSAVVTMAGFVVLINRVFWKKLYRLAEDRYSLG